MATVAEIEALLTARDKMSPVIRQASDVTEKETRRMGRMWDGLKVGIGGAMKATGLALGAAGIGFGFAAKKAVDMNSMLETSTLQFETLMGDADRAREHVGMLFEFGAKTPFETGPIIEASRMLQTFGGDALNTSGQLTRVGDAAAAVSAPMEEVAFWVGRANSAIQSGKPFGEAAMRLQELGIMSPKARQEMEDLQKAGADASEVWAVMEGDLDRFSGSMEKQSKSWDGIVSNITDNVQMMNASALAPLFDWLKRIGQSTADWLMSDEAAEFAKRVARGVQRAIDKLTEWGEFLSGAFKGHMAEGLTPLQAMIETAKDVAKKLMDMIPSSVSQNLGGLSTAFMMLGGPMGLIVRDLLPALKPVIDAIIPTLAQMANDLAPALASIFAELATSAVPVLVDILGKLAAILKEHPEFVQAIIGAWAAFKGGQMVISAFKGITSAFGALKAALAANPWLLLIAATVALVVLVVKNWDKITAFLGRTWDWIKDTAGAVWEWLKRTFKAALDWVVNAVLNWTLVGQLIKHWDDIKDGITEVKNWIIDRWNDVLNFFRDLPGKVSRAVTGMWDGMKDSFRGAMNWIIDKWNRLDFAIGPFRIPDWIPGVGGNSFHIPDIFPDIPRFHAGGMVPGRPGQEVPIIAEAGEHVISRQDVESGRGGATHHWHLGVMGDPFAFADAVEWRLRTAGI